MAAVCTTYYSGVAEEYGKSCEHCQNGSVEKSLKSVGNESNANDGLSYNDESCKQERSIKREDVEGEQVNLKLVNADEFGYC